MGIKLGLNEIVNCSLGSTQLSSIFLGNTEIWTNDPFEYDYILEGNYDEIDLIYTTDIHGCWLGYQTSGRGIDTKFSYANNLYKNVKQYKNNLESIGIPVLCIDCGDYTHYTGQGRLINNSYGLDAVNLMNEVGYFAATIGNHEYKAGADNNYGTAIVDNILKKFKGNSNDCSVIACNLINKSTNTLEFKPYKLAKIGNKKIAIIGVAFSGPDGNKTDWLNNYTFLDDMALYTKLQEYINLFKKYKFDYIGVIAHLGWEPDDGNRCLASCEGIINNTSGISFICPGHSHASKNNSTHVDQGGNTVTLCAQPQCDFGYISRIRLTPSNIESYLLTTY